MAETRTASGEQADPTTIATLLGDLAAASSGRPSDTRRLAGMLGGRFGARPLAVGADLALFEALDALWPRGWGPRDVVEVAARRIGSSARPLALDVLAADGLRRPRGHGAELDVLGAEVWWDRGRPLVEQWSVGRGLAAAEALRSAIVLTRLLRTLPALPLVETRTDATPAGVDPKVLARVRALLAKAESTTFAEEAEALSAKAQELMGRHALEQAMLAPSDGGAAHAGARRLWLDAPYTSAKSSLVHQVAIANRCRAVSLDALDMVTVVGDAADLATVELLVTSLLVQADRAMLAAGRDPGRGASVGRARTRSFRHSFLLAYATRIGERLAEAAREAETRARAEVGEALLPVLAARADAVDRTVTELFPRLTTRRFSVGDGAGWAAGRAAADSASLSPGRDAVRGSPRQR